MERKQLTYGGAQRTLGHNGRWGTTDPGAQRTLGQNGHWGTTDLGYIDMLPKRAQRTLGHNGPWGTMDLGHIDMLPFVDDSDNASLLCFSSSTVSSVQCTIVMMKESSKELLFFSIIFYVDLV